MPDNEIVFPNGKILFILPENERLDTVFAKKLAAAQPGETDAVGNGRKYLNLTLAGGSMIRHVKGYGWFQLIFDAESRKVVLEGERLVSQTRMGDAMVGREIVSRVEAPFQFLAKMELYALDLPGGEAASCSVSPISVWMDNAAFCSKMANAAYEFVLSSLPQFCFFFPQTGMSMTETVYYKGKPTMARLFQAIAVAGGRICSREFQVTEI